MSKLAHSGNADMDAIERQGRKMEEQEAPDTLEYAIYKVLRALNSTRDDDRAAWLDNLHDALLIASAERDRLKTDIVELVSGLDDLAELVEAHLVHGDVSNEALSNELKKAVALISKHKPEGDTDKALPPPAIPHPAYLCLGNIITYLAEERKDYEQCSEAERRHHIYSDVRTLEQVLEKWLEPVTKHKPEGGAPREVRTVSSSHGQLAIDAYGQVIRHHVHEPETDDGKLFLSIRAFNLNEWRDYWKEERLPACFDILDLGYWYSDGNSSKYAEPDATWRKDIAEDLLKREKGEAV